MPRLCTLVVAFAVATLAACRTPVRRAVPGADLLFATDDSSFWVTSDANGLRVRGAPMQLARLGGRFHEVYVADDDRSFYDAVFVGQRLFARDLIRGDSVELFSDTVVPRLAREYARTNPREQPLAPDESASDHPHTTATADFEILDIDGPYLSMEYRTDVDITDGRQTVDRHSARRAVIDLRTGRGVDLATLFGGGAADSAIAAAVAEWRSARDTLIKRRDDPSHRITAALGEFVFDAGSFVLGAHDREPQVVFAVPGEIAGGPLSALELTPRTMPEAPWWRSVRDELPLDSGGVSRWPHGAVAFVARHGDSSDLSRLALRDAARREWPIGVVSSPVHRVIWLDASVSAVARKALHRAFDDAALYSDETRVAALRRRPAAGATVLNVGRPADRRARRAARPHSRRRPAPHSSS